MGGSRAPKTIFQNYPPKLSPKPITQTYLPKPQLLFGMHEPFRRLRLAPGWETHPRLGCVRLRCRKALLYSFGKQTPPTPPRFQCWRKRGVAAKGQNGCTTPKQIFLISNIELGGRGGPASSPKYHRCLLALLMGSSSGGASFCPSTVSRIVSACSVPLARQDHCSRPEGHG